MTASRPAAVVPVVTLAHSACRLVYAAGSGILKHEVEDDDTAVPEQDSELGRRYYYLEDVDS